MKSLADLPRTEKEKNPGNKGEIKFSGIMQMIKNIRKDIGLPEDIIQVVAPTTDEASLGLVEDQIPEESSPVSLIFSSRLPIYSLEQSSFDIIENPNPNRFTMEGSSRRIMVNKINNHVSHVLNQVILQGKPFDRKIKQNVKVLEEDAKKIENAWGM